MASGTSRHDKEYSCSIKIENSRLVKLLLVAEESLLHGISWLVNLNFQSGGMVLAIFPEIFVFCSKKSVEGCSMI
jgi:hypothetical protein